MFNVVKFKELIKERIKVSIETQDEWDYGINKIWNKLTDLICENIDDSIEYILNDCSEDEFSWLSEIFEQIVEKTLSQKFIDATRIVAKKYPLEDKKYNISSEIDWAQGRLDYLLNPED